MLNAKNGLSPITLTNSYSFFDKFISLYWSDEFYPYRSKLKTVTLEEKEIQAILLIASKDFGFTTNDDIETLETYLQSGRLYFARSNENDNKHHNTRTWQDAFLFHVVKSIKERSNRHITYDEIANAINDIFAIQGQTKKVSGSTLRKIYSRGVTKFLPRNPKYSTV